MLLFTTACANSQHTVYVSKHANYNYDRPDVKDWNHFFIGGVLQESTTDAYQLCSARGFNDVETVITEQRWYQSWITGMTWGLYSPRITYVWCKK